MRISRGLVLLASLCWSVAVCLNECRGTTRSSSTVPLLLIYAYTRHKTLTIGRHYKRWRQIMIWDIVKWRVWIDKVKVLWHMWVTIVCGPRLPYHRRFWDQQLWCRHRTTILPMVKSANWDRDSKSVLLPKMKWNLPLACPRPQLLPRQLQKFLVEPGSNMLQRGVHRWMLRWSPPFLEPPIQIPSNICCEMMSVHYSLVVKT